ncbi:MAG: PAC2 family protein [Desulfurococcales archaeon]|nr:PAC2 family protein [Desulfurococcales archaeon]
MAEVVLRVPRNLLEGSILVTGFRGFGMVGYLLTKYAAQALGARKAGFILPEGDIPPMIIIESDGPGFPYEIYYSEEPRVVFILNRAMPEREEWTAYTEALASFAAELGVKLAVLAGGLSRDYMPENEEYGYRWIGNSYYLKLGGKLPAPQMEEGLGVMGPLATLYILMEYYEIPTLILLPYSMVEEVDYDAVLRGMKVLSEILGVELKAPALEEAAEKQKALLMKLAEMSESGEESPRRRESGPFYM